MTTLVYLIGRSGSGKSTAARALTRNLVATQRDTPVAHTEYRQRDSDKIVAIRIGRWHANTYVGTDAVHKSQARELADFIGHHDAPLAIAEGRMFSYPAWFDMATAAGAKIKLIHLAATTEQIQHRQTERSKTTGRPTTVGSSPGKAIDTEVDNLVARYHPPQISATANPDKIANTIADLIGQSTALGLP